MHILQESRVFLSVLVLFYSAFSDPALKNKIYYSIIAELLYFRSICGTGVRIGPPPDLPSLLLHNRIVYIGMPLVPAVTELIIAELLYLNYEDTNKPITMYINSSGTTTADGRSVGFETEAFAIADVMKYVRPPVCTVAVGQAFGAAAMLLVRNRTAIHICSLHLCCIFWSPFNY